MKHLLLSFGAAIMAASACAAAAAPASAVFPRNHGQLDLRFGSVQAPEKLPQTPATRADEAEEGDKTLKMDYTLSFSPYQALRLNDVDDSYEVLQAFEMTPDVLYQFEGATVTSVNILSGINSQTRLNEITEVTVFLSHDPQQLPFYEQKGTLSTEPWTMNSVTLDTPYVVDPKQPLFIGYALTSKSKSDMYMVLDGVPTSNTAGGWYSVRKGLVTETWQNLASSYGSLCIGCTVEGDNLPLNGVRIFMGSAQEYVFPGDPFSAKLYVTGDAANEANSVEVEYQVGNSDPKTKEITFENALGYHTEGDIDLIGLVCEEEGIDLPLSITITKVNGEPNSSLDKSAELSFWCYSKDKAYPRAHLVEEGTGTWCGYCPAGIVALDYMKENYPDQFCPVAIHAGDEMEVESTLAVKALYSGFPEIFIDRNISEYPTATNFNLYIDAYAELALQYPSLFDLSLSAKVLEEGMVDIDTQVKVGLDVVNENRFRVGFYLTEDYVGPYIQTNYYNQFSVEMGGWENKASQVRTYYDDVVRDLASPSAGVNNSLPAEMEAGTTYDYSMTTALSGIKFDKFYVTAFLFDGKAGRVLNARRVEVENPYGAGMEEVGADSAVKVRGVKGGIELGAAVANVYDFSGVCVASAASDFVALPAGFYLVTVGQQTFKVLVR